jgi:hypothetical protein
MNLAFADAFDFRSMQGIYLRSALTLLLLAHAARQREQIGKLRLQRGVARYLRPMSRMARPR